MSSPRINRVTTTAVLIIECATGLRRERQFLADVSRERRANPGVWRPLDKAFAAQVGERLVLVQKTR